MGVALGGAEIGLDGAEGALEGREGDLHGAEGDRAGGDGRLENEDERLDPPPPGGLAETSKGNETPNSTPMMTVQLNFPIRERVILRAFLTAKCRLLTL